MRVASDLALSADGDLVVKDNDLVIVDKGAYHIQCAINRIKSITTDWRYDHIGADIEDIIGMPNTQDTADLGVSKIKNALIEDGLFDEKDVYVRPVPVSKTKTIFFTFINSPFFSEPIGLVVELDLSSGMVKITEG